MAVGRIRSGWAKDACDDYLGRLKRALPTEMVEVRDVPRTKGATVAALRAAEAEGLRAALEPGEVLVALDERGKEWDSRAFADWLGQRRDEGRRSVAFLIGGPDGLDESLRVQADRVWCFGRATMAHELARVVLLEQIYRAATLWAGLPYHRD